MSCFAHFDSVSLWVWFCWSENINVTVAHILCSPEITTHWEETQQWKTKTTKPTQAWAGTNLIHMSTTSVMDQLFCDQAQLKPDINKNLTAVSSSRSAAQVWWFPSSAWWSSRTEACRRRDATGERSTQSSCWSGRTSSSLSWWRRPCSPSATRTAQLHKPTVSHSRTQLVKVTQGSVK